LSRKREGIRLKSVIGTEYLVKYINIMREIQGWNSARAIKCNDVKRQEGLIQLIPNIYVIFSFVAVSFFRYLLYLVFIEKL